LKNSNYEFRKVSADDYEYVYHLKKEAYKKYVELNFGPWDETQQRIFFERFIDSCGDRIFIITVDGQDTGFYNFEENKTEYEIGNICLEPQFRGMGIGTAILSDILENNSDKEIHLQYFKQNPVGALYKRLGFEPAGESASHFKMVRKAGA